jgi:CO/xanthine dehydrogenase FAD-binding subunit
VAASASGTREISIEDFLLGSYATALEPEEMITEVRFPVGPDRFAFLERNRKHNDFAIINVAVAGRRDHGSGRWSDVRVGLGGVHDHALLVHDAERLLDGSALEDELVAEAARCAVEAVDPPTDVRASAEYRRHLVGVYVRRALTALRDDNGGAYE